MVVSDVSEREGVYGVGTGRSPKLIEGTKSSKNQTEKALPELKLNTGTVERPVLSLSFHIDPMYQTAVTRSFSCVTFTGVPLGNVLLLSTM